MVHVNGPLKQLNFGRRTWKGLPTNWMSCFFACSLLILALNTVSKSSFSLCLYVCIGLPGPAHPSLSEIFSQIAFLYTSRVFQNISLREGVLVLEGQYIHTERKWAFRHSIQGQHEQRTSKEQAVLPFISIHPRNCAKSSFLTLH